MCARSVTFGIVIMDSTSRFSPYHGFSQSTIEQTVEQVRTEDPRKRWLIAVTSGHRRLTIRQAIASQIAALLVLFGSYAVELALPSVERDSLNLWAGAALALMLVRTALFWKVLRATPAVVAGSLALRVTPLLIAIVASAPWAWASLLFVGPDMTPTTLVLVLGFILMSVAAMGLWTTTPAGSLLYLVLLWLPLSAQMLLSGELPAPVLVIFLLVIVGIVCVYTFTAINQIRFFLDRSDKVDLLLAELREANEKLDAMRSAMARELEVRSAFFDSASHDVKQRLHAMRLFMNAARQGSRQEGLDRLSDAVEDLERYSRALLDTAKAHAAPLQPDKKPTPVHTVFNRVEIAFESFASEHGVELMFRSTSVIVRTDPLLLQRMLENLVSNAVRFTAGRVLVAARRRQGALAIEVWDQGPGIRKEVRVKVFAPFFQDTSHRGARQIESSRFAGVGLGLSIVKRFADALDYRIDLKSTPRGSVVRILVPSTDIER